MTTNLAKKRRAKPLNPLEEAFNQLVFGTAPARADSDAPDPSRKFKTQKASLCQSGDYVYCAWNKSYGVVQVTAHNTIIVYLRPGNHGYDLLDKTESCNVADEIVTVLRAPYRIMLEIT